MAFAAGLSGCFALSSEFLAQGSDEKEVKQ